MKRGQLEVKYYHYRDHEKDEDIPGILLYQNQHYIAHLTDEEAQSLCSVIQDTLIKGKVRRALRPDTKQKRGPRK